MGGLATDGDEHHAIDNSFLAIPMNKGVLGAVVIGVIFLLLMWRLCQNHCKIAVCEKSNGKEQCRKGNSKKGNGSEKRNHQNDGAACPFWGQYSG